MLVDTQTVKKNIVKPLNRLKLTEQVENCPHIDGRMLKNIVMNEKSLSRSKARAKRVANI